MPAKHDDDNQMRPLLFSFLIICVFAFRFPLTIFIIDEGGRQQEKQTDQFAIQIKDQKETILRTNRKYAVYLLPPQQEKPGVFSIQ